MPKVPRCSVIAMDKSTGLYEVIKLSKANRVKFAKIGAPNFQKLPVLVPLDKGPPLTPTESEELSGHHQEHRETLSLLSRLTLERKTLEERLSDPPTPLPLIHRLSDKPKPIHIPPPIPKTLKFCKSKLLKRIKEFKPNLTSTLVRLQPIAKKLNEEAEREKMGLPITVSPEVGIRLWDIYQRLEKLEEKLDTIGHTLTNAQWRKMGVSLRSIGRVSFENLAKRFPEVCKELDNLDIQLPEVTLACKELSN